MVRRAGLTEEYAWNLGPVRQGLAAVLDTGGWKAEVIAPAITDAYNNRGGTVTTLPVLVHQRTEPCLMTATSAVIDYQGPDEDVLLRVPGGAAHAGYVI
jgi:hypothetical protein